MIINYNDYNKGRKDTLIELLQACANTYPDAFKEFIQSICSNYFDTNKGDSYAYWLTRDKSAFGVGTMTIEDFEEFTEDTISDLGEFIYNELQNYCK